MVRWVLVAVNMVRSLPVSGGYGQSQKAGIVPDLNRCDDYCGMALIRTLEQLIGERPDAEPLYQVLLEILRDDGARFDGACWHVSDPLTGLFARTGVIGEVPG